MDVERKLLEYRAKKRREYFLNQQKQGIKSLFNNLINFRNRKSTTKKEMKESTTINVIEKEQLEELLPPNDVSDEDLINDENLLTCTKLDLFYYFLIFILWATVYVIFIKLQFGTVFLIVSAVIAMYFNTRTGPRRPDEVSAYSVFNKNCESIDGTLKAEQFEREIRYGSGAVH